MFRDFPNTAKFGKFFALKETTGTPEKRGQVLVTQAATFNLCSILGNEHPERGLGSFLEAVRRVFFLVLYSDPVYPTPDKLKNAALFLRLGLPSYPLKTLSKPERQGSCGSWKTWKVLEFYSDVFQVWKVQEKGDWSRKILEIC